MADFQADYALDGVVLGLSVGWVLVAELAPVRTPEAPVGNGRRGDPLEGAWDDELARRRDEGALDDAVLLAGVSDGVVLGALMVPAAYAGARLAAGGDDRRAPVDHALLAWEGGMVALALAEVAKVTADAERPYVALCGHDAGCYADLGVGKVVVDAERPLVLDSEARSSFFSGHTALAGGTTFALAHVVAFGGPGRPPVLRVVLPYVAAAAVTSTVAVLRVESARHYPTDVLVGGLVGASVGVAVAEFHRAPGGLAASPLPGGALLAWTGPL